jgi:hypothetical protein
MLNGIRQRVDEPRLLIGAVEVLSGAFAVCDPKFIAELIGEGERQADRFLDAL